MSFAQTQNLGAYTTTSNEGGQKQLIAVPPLKVLCKLLSPKESRRWSVRAQVFGAKESDYSLHRSSIETVDLDRSHSVIRLTSLYAVYIAVGWWEKNLTN